MCAFGEDFSFSLIMSSTKMWNTEEAKNGKIRWYVGNAFVKMKNRKEIKELNYFSRFHFQFPCIKWLLMDISSDKFRKGFEFLENKENKFRQTVAMWWRLCNWNHMVEGFISLCYYLPLLSWCTINMTLKHVVFICSTNSVAHTSQCTGDRLGCILLIWFCVLNRNIKWKQRTQWL